MFRYTQRLKTVLRHLRESSVYMCLQWRLNMRCENNFTYWDVFLKRYWKIAKSNLDDWQFTHAPALLRVLHVLFLWRYLFSPVHFRSWRNALLRMENLRLQYWHAKFFSFRCVAWRWSLLAVLLPRIAQQIRHIHLPSAVSVKLFSRLGVCNGITTMTSTTSMNIELRM